MNHPVMPPACSTAAKGSMEGLPRETCTRPVREKATPTPPATWWGTADLPERARTSSTEKATRTRGSTTEKMPTSPAALWWMKSPASPEIWNHSRRATTIAMATSTKARASRLSWASVALHAAAHRTAPRPIAENTRASRPGAVLADEAGAGCAPFGERGLAGFFLGDAERFDWLAMML